MVLEGEYFSAYVPFAARWPLEVHLVPHRQVPDLAALTGAERDEFSVLYPELLGRLDALYGPHAVYRAWHQAPVDPVLRRSGYLHLQLTSPRRAADKLKFLAGSEAAMGAFINDTPPEEVAARLRDAEERQRSRPRDRRRNRARMETGHAEPAASLRGPLRKSFGAPDGVWPAPGRVNLIGEHTDYNDGFVLPFAIDSAPPWPWRPGRTAPCRLASGVRGRGPGRIRSRYLRPGPGGGLVRVPRPAWPGSWNAAGITVPGFDLCVTSDVPVGAGLSSSAALECAVALALSDLTGAAWAGRDWRTSGGGPKTTWSAPPPASWTSRPRCSAPDLRRLPGLPRPKTAQPCRSAWRRPGFSAW